MACPWNWLSGTAGFKAEVNTREASSYFPNGTGTSNLKANTDSNTYKFAEACGLRFKAIPRTVLYTDLSFEQSQNHLLVNQNQALTTVAYTALNRDAFIDEPAITWTAGADFQPVRFINLTSQFRLRDKDMNFHDDPVRSMPTGGQVFIDSMTVQTIGFTQRATARLSGWAQTSFRYLFDDSKYDVRAAYETVDEKARMMSNTFIYDLSVYPVSNLSVTGSFSQLYSETKTVASSAPGLYLAPFTSNSSTWMLASDYQPHKKVEFNSSLFYTLANNYADNQDTNVVNYAAAFDQMGLTVACKWKVREDLIVQPQYGYSRYMPNESSPVGAAYDAQIVSVAVTHAWG
jgi:hypothetical protein